MQEMEIDLNFVLKCLPNLKPDKAVGPDSIKPVVLLLLYAPFCFRQPYKLDSSLKLEKGTILSFIQKGDQTEPSQCRGSFLKHVYMQHIHTPKRA